jgi:hypothetical protein
MQFVGPLACTLRTRPLRVVALADTQQFHADLSLVDGAVLLCVGDVCRAGDREHLAEFLGRFVARPH